jgi:hypothetical protein
MTADWVDRWHGQTVVCMASGPSLCTEDCELVRSAGVPCIVTNTTFQLAPWADVLFGVDGAWWARYHEEVDATFSGARMTTSQQAVRYGAANIGVKPWFRNYGNSGACAVSLAVVAGAKTVVLLGYDVQKTGGRTHWHGDHPANMSNARSIKAWPGKFAQLARYAKKQNCRVVNASRETALKCFQRGRLVDELQCVAAMGG